MIRLFASYLPVTVVTELAEDDLYEIVIEVDPEMMP